MPALSFGLKATKPAVPTAHTGLKRKQNLLEEDVGSDEEPNGVPASVSAKRGKTSNGGEAQQFSNLSALHSAKKHNDEANKLDSSVYDYDNVYETFHAPKETTTTKSAGPKYMKSLMQSAEVRKRDELRAKERLLQREREAEGEEFADKEKFVTGAYKAQQEELKKMEEEEARREAEEEEKRKKGAGMSGFYKDLLKKDEERSRQLAKAAEEAGARKDTVVEDLSSDEKADATIAEELNGKGAHVIVNDEGEIVDKRQLLSAGLNVAKKPKAATEDKSKATSAPLRTSDYSKASTAKSAREAQRERQTRMMAEQLEEMAEKQAQQEAEERRVAEDKAKSQKSSTDVMSAKERYLARKRERGEEAKKGKAAG